MILGDMAVGLSTFVGTGRCLDKITLKGLVPVYLCTCELHAYVKGCMY